VEGPGDNCLYPHWTTLHRWLTFFGERGLDRLPLTRSRGTTPRGSFFIPWLPVSALSAESAKRLRRGIKRIWVRPVEIPAWKYRTPRRREQLQACARLLSTAAHLFPDDPYPLTAWESWIVEHLDVAGWWFPSSYACTANITDLGRSEEIRYLRTSKKRKKEANNGPRAPPGGVFSF
jgi:hypothetical protein